MDADLTDDDYRALAEFRHQLRRFLLFSERAARAAGIEPRQYQLLLAIRADGGEDSLTIGELASRLLLRHHSAVELVDRSVRQGLVARRRDDLDRRRVFVDLTPAGATVLGQLARAHREELRLDFSSLTRLLAWSLPTAPGGGDYDRDAEFLSPP